MNPLEEYWQQIPIGKQNAVSYAFLQSLWGMSDKRKVRNRLHELSGYDNGDPYVLIRSSKNRDGFYRTDDADEISAFRLETLHKGRSTFAPIRKCNRILAIPKGQMALDFEFLYD